MCVCVCVCVCVCGTTGAFTFNQNERRQARKDGNLLFSDALNTFYILLSGVVQMIKDHSDS